MNASAADANVNRTLSLAGTCTAVFTFTLVFLFPKFSAGELDPILFQAALAASGVSILSIAYSGMNYYILTLAVEHSIERAERYRRRADWVWQVGFALFLLQPSLILFSVGLFVVASFFLALWLLYFILIVKVFRETQGWIRKGV